MATGQKPGEVPRRTLRAWQLWWELREFLPNTGANTALSQEGVQFGIIPKGLGWTQSPKEG